MAWPGVRVRCCSRRAVLAALERLSEPLRDRLQGERQQEARRIFETAVQENILINGMLWQEVSEEEDLRYGNGIKNLDDDLDECIKETTSKRKQFPRKIIGHLAKTMKAERELLSGRCLERFSREDGGSRYDSKISEASRLKLYQPAVNMQMKMEVHPEQVSKETEIMKTTSNISQDMSDAMKDLPVFMEKAQGLLQTLSLAPVVKQSQTNKTVFSNHTEMEFQNDKGQAFPIGNTDVTPIETDKKKSLRNRSSRKRKINSSVNHKYPKRRLHLGQ
ncbi:kinetochore-associated protein NSL1 homolog isoform X1 [Pristis pectinata]|uniref:kinetochore-associated protein NSL1 homolog isoform X1 n=1 Tax=Pristis pectinata TaxID=685728 RepID=UPI00223DE042|nr:kinetochore-associated protein NSL1 homolog isoform X1 [Pristis pectinata]